MCLLSFVSKKNEDSLAFWISDTIQYFYVEYRASLSFKYLLLFQHIQYICLGNCMLLQMKEHAHKTLLQLFTGNSLYSFGNASPFCNNQMTHVNQKNTVTVETIFKCSAQSSTMINVTMCK